MSDWKIKTAILVAAAIISAVRTDRHEVKPTPKIMSARLPIQSGWLECFGILSARIKRSIRLKGVTTPVIATRAMLEKDALMAILLICGNPIRMEQLKAALQSGGLHLVASRSVEDGWRKSTPSTLAGSLLTMELTNLFRHGSAMVQ